MTKPIYEVVNPPSLPDEGEWIVLHVLSRQERALGTRLTAMGIPYYLPIFRQVRFHGRRKVVKPLPAFPGYLFLRGDMDMAYEADRTRRVAQIIKVPDQVQMDWELRNIHLAISMEAPLDPYPYLKEGDRAEVRVMMGPGVDPYLYKASAGDVRTLSDADVIFYNGLHLEGKMTDILGRLAARQRAEKSGEPVVRAGSLRHHGSLD